MRRKLVLVADPDPSIRHVLSKALSAGPYIAVQAADGASARERFRDGAAWPDLVVGDLLMPTAPGSNLARLFRGDARLRGLPIIALVARSAAEVLLLASELSVRHFVQKPFRVTDLMSKVELCLR